MGLEAYPDQLEPQDQDVEIWRFMKLKRFRELIATAELYFCRADLFDDEREGLPPEEYLGTLGLNPFDINDRRQLLNTIGSDAQFRESFYVSCWHLFREETCKMWEGYAAEGGVAICSRYRLLKSALALMNDRAFIGLVRYGAAHLIGQRYNLFRLITTKRIQYEDEREVRAFLWIIDPHGGGNRHIDADNRIHPLPLTPPPPSVLIGHGRKVDLRALVTGIVVSPRASPATFDEVNQLVRNSGYAIPVRHSDLTRYRDLLP